MKHLLYIKFNVDEKDYIFWKEGGLLTEETSHKIATFKWKSIIDKATKFTTFKHLKRTYIEVEISFSEEDLLEIIYEAIA